MTESQDRAFFSGDAAQILRLGRSAVGLVVTFAVAGLVALVPIPSNGDSPGDAPAEAVRASVPSAPVQAAAAIARFRKELGGALRRGLAKGPVEAISACRLDAPRVTGEIGEDGIAVGRTSHRLRNPANAPEDWMRPLLEEYRAGEPSPGSSRTVDLGDRGRGTVEPIYMKPLCATCHGENLDPALLASIREQYPEDEAVGFRIGEFRGLFWAVTNERVAP